jgi:hypothetical protein
MWAKAARPHIRPRPDDPSGEPEMTEMNPLMTIDLGAIRRQELLAEAQRARLVPSRERSVHRLAAAFRHFIAIRGIQVPRIRPTRS